jgi:hypothetical protein
MMVVGSLAVLLWFVLLPRLRRDDVGDAGGAAWKR